MNGHDTVERIEPRAALRRLGYPDTTAPQRVAGGWDTLLWRFATPDGREHSLRVFRLERLREIAWRERLALERCAAEGLPAPRVEAAGEVDGAPAMILSWCPGTPLLSRIERGPWAVWRLGRLFGRTQAQIHAVAPPPEFVARSGDEWRSRVAQEYADLARHAASMQASSMSLIHMDFHPLNVICDGTRVTGVVDWAGAAAGDPRADQARTAITLLAAPAPPGPLRPVVNFARRLMLRAWRSGYEELAGAMPDYQPFMAWAGATLLAEIELVIGQPNVWGTERDIAELRRLVDVWAREAGIR